jgi:hypothetical protein
MDSIFPEIAVSISTRHSIRRLLNTGEHCIKALNKKGMIDELESATFIKRIEAQLKHLVFFPPSIPLPSKDQLFHEIEWMNTLDDQTFNMLCTAAKPQLFNPNELILKQGEVSNFVFIVARGSVNVLVNVNGEEREIQHKVLTDWHCEHSLLAWTCSSLIFVSTDWTVRTDNFLLAGFFLPSSPPPADSTFLTGNASLKSSYQQNILY